MGSPEVGLQNPKTRLETCPPDRAGARPLSTNALEHFATDGSCETRAE
jgi:hypothetical protein